jgi:hypothetical protein
MALEIRPCEADEIPKVVAFFRDVWGPDHIFVRDPEFMIWQMGAGRDVHLAHPVISALNLWSDRQLVGFLGLINCDLNIDGRTFKSYWMCNFSVHPEYRAAGAGPRLLMEALRLPVDAIAAAGIRPDIYHFFRAMKYRTIDRVPRYIRPLDAKGCAALIGCPPDDIAAAPTAPSANHEALVEACRYDSGCADWDAYWRAYTERGYIGVDRTGAYMRWRYVDHPRLAYRVVTARRRNGGALQGHAVYRIETARDVPIQVARLIEFTALSHEVRLPLLRHVENAARDAGALFIDHYNTSADPVFRDAAGWQTEPEVPTLVFPALFQPVFRGYHKIAVIIRFLGNLHVTDEDFARKFQFVKSDGDQDRIN